MQFFLMRKAILCGACVYVCMWKCVISLIHVIFVPYSVMHVCARECLIHVYLSLTLWCMCVRVNAVGSYMSNYSVLSVCVCVNVHV
jgi:hypothetical protein